MHRLSRASWIAPPVGSSRVLIAHLLRHSPCPQELLARCGLELGKKHITKGITALPRGRGQALGRSRVRKVAMDEPAKVSSFCDHRGRGSWREGARRAQGRESDVVCWNKCAAESAREVGEGQSREERRIPSWGVTVVCHACAGSPVIEAPTCSLHEKKGHAVHFTGAEGD